MAHAEGFVATIAPRSRTAFLAHAADFAALARTSGATRVLQSWGERVVYGTVNDFRRTLPPREGETVVLSWLEHESRAAHDAAFARMSEDARAVPLLIDGTLGDGRPMIERGFFILLDEQAEGRTAAADRLLAMLMTRATPLSGSPEARTPMRQGPMSDGAGGTVWLDGFVAPMPSGPREAQRRTAADLSTLFRRHGALAVMAAWSDAIRDEAVADLRLAANARLREEVLALQIIWPSSVTQDAAWEQVRADPRLRPDDDALLLDAARIVPGNFLPTLDAFT